MMLLRKVEKLYEDAWITIQMSELKDGDVFRLTEPHDEEPFGTYTATSDAYLMDGVWGVNGIHKED